MSAAISTHPITTETLSQNEAETLGILEWPTLFDHLLKECWLPYGVLHWQQDLFLATPIEVRQHLAEVEALRVLIIRYGEPIIDDVIETTAYPVLKRLSKGGLLIRGDVAPLMKSLVTGTQYLKHFKTLIKRDRQATSVSETLASTLDLAEYPNLVLDYLNKKFEPDGQVKDTATDNLHRLTRSLRKQKSMIQERCQQFIQKPEYRAMLQSPALTERDGRLVLPVRATFKSKIKGVIHAGSSSGATLFVEPEAVIQLNNQLQSTEQDIEDEIAAILRDASRFLEEHVETLEQFLHSLGWLDKRCAAARLAVKLDATIPEILEESASLSLKQMKHPLLLLQELFLQNNDDVVGNDLTLNNDTGRMLVITGPNTGGKTVLLKTLGLCALMMRAGLPLPVKDGSSMSLFQPVLSDIGDTQNIAQNLSTFSGHLARLKAFISQDLDLTNGLVLIDEICAGTDPTEGAALAKAVLKTLHDKGAVTVVTTHLGVLKTEAHEQPGYINASVEFDAEKLRPTYRLLVGIPGASNAITIAHRLGLPEAIINQARANLTQRTRESSELLQELEQKIRQAEEDRQLAASYKKSAEDTYKRVEANRHEQEFNKRHILQQFRQSLKDRVFQLEAELKHLKKKFKQEEFSEDTDLRLKRLSHAADKVMDTTDSEIEAEAIPLEAREITVGDVVSSKRWNVTGEVLSINKDKITIQAAMMTVTAGRTDLTKVGTEKYIQQKKQPKKASVGSIPMPNKSPELECHLLGLKRVDALDKMQEYLDQVSLAGYGKVGIIHGQGGGVLKKAVREYLKEADFVKKFYPADAVDGGDGKTIVEL